MVLVLNDIGQFVYSGETVFSLVPGGGKSVWSLQAPFASLRGGKMRAKGGREIFYRVILQKMFVFNIFLIFSVL